MIHVATSAPQIDDGDNIQLVSSVQCDETSTIRHRSEWGTPARAFLSG